MDSPQDTAALPAVGFPIRTSTDRSLVGGSPWLIAATHVLRRLLEPRHPPHALSSLVTQNSGLSSLRSSLPSSRSRSRALGKRPRTSQRPAGRCFLYPSYSIVRELSLRAALLPGAPEREVPDEN